MSTGKKDLTSAGSGWRRGAAASTLLRGGEQPGRALPSSAPAAGAEIYAERAAMCRTSPAPMTRQAREAA